MSNRVGRRAVEFRFQSLQELIRYYRCYLAEPQIEAGILEAGMHFISRTFGTPARERLQFIRRCEASLEALRLQSVENSNAHLLDCAKVSA